MTARMSHLMMAGLAAILVAALPAAASAQQASASAASPAVSDTAWTRITYITGRSAYLEIGSREGLREGMTLQVMRDGANIAELAVEYLSSTRASCTITRQSRDLAVGDSVRWQRPAPQAVVVAEGAPSSAAARAAARRTGPPPLRGRVGLRYLVLAPDGGVGGITQPAYDLRLDGDRLGGTAFGITADVRAQRTAYSSSGGGTRAPQSVTHVYQAALSWAPGGSAPRITVGRQFAAALSSVGLFDGAAIDLDRSRWSVGAFSGMQPDAASFGLSGDVREHGVYGQLHTPTGRANPWSLTLGGIGSYEAGQIDREFGFARVASNGPRYSLYATQEVDVNRGWKLQREGKATTPTATFATLYLMPVDAVSVFGGYDNRRNVRLYRDYVNPELAFDDSFRVGTWGGISVAPVRRLRLSADLRQSDGGAAGQARSVTGTASVTGITRLRIGGQARLTTYDGDMSAGRLASGSLEVNPWGLFRLSANGGQRTTLARAGVPLSQLTWHGADADFGIGRSVYVLLSWYREADADRRTTQGYMSLSWRF